MKEIIVPVITPLNADETINHKELARLTKTLMAEGADGIFSAGSSSECFMMSESERREMTETVIGASGGGKVIAHVGAIGVKPTTELARHAERCGAAAVASVPPFYFNYDFANIKEYYLALADSVSIPVMIYYVPVCVGGRLSADEIAEIMNARENIGIIKYTDSDYFTMQRIKALTGKTVYSGKDECFLSAIAAGADGAIGTTFNFMLKEYKDIARLYEAGRNAEALEIQCRVNAVIDACMKCSDFFNASKFLVSLKGFETGNARRPFIPLDGGQKEFLRRVYKENIEDGRKRIAGA